MKRRSFYNDFSRRWDSATMANTVTAIRRQGNLKLNHHEARFQAWIDADRQLRQGS